MAVKLVLFFCLIGISLFISVFGYFYVKAKFSMISQQFSISLLIPALILASSSVWWFFTETDGISQMMGVLINGGGILVIGIINIVIYLLNRVAKFSKDSKK
jgi:hypothetical protein